MIAALLETIGALSVLASVAAKIAWMRDARDEVIDEQAAPGKRPHRCIDRESRRRRRRHRSSARVSNERR
jgi:hypothetical protein